MTRLLSALLGCALTLSAQKIDPPARIALIDAVVTDAARHPVNGLTSADFEVSEGGQTRAVVRLTAFDTVRHTAATLGEIPALDLTPDQIHRTIVIVVDDLCLSADGITEARRQLRQMVETRLVFGDRVAILRTSSGTGREQQLSGDSRQIAAAIDPIQYLPGGISRGSCAVAAWSTVRYALTGLNPIAGRKAVVLLSGELPAPSGIATSEITRLAARSATALYVHAGVTASTLAAATGGAAGVDLDHALEEQRSFYVLGFASDAGREVLVKLRRPDLTLRSRQLAISLPPRVDLPAPPTPAELIQQVINSPFEGAAIGVRLTALVSIDPKEGAIVEGVLYINVRDLSFLRDEKGKYHVEFELNIGSALEAGQTGTPITGAHAVDLTEDEYRRVEKEGLIYPFHLNAWTAGARRVRAAVLDSRSGRTGTANAFVEVRDVSSGEFFLSGLMLQGVSQTVKESAAVRAFRAGQRLTFTYSVHNAARNQDGRSEVEPQVRILAEDRVMYVGRPSPLQFEPAPNDRRQQLTGTISLDSAISPGHYILQVTVVDKAHPQARSASQFTDFTIEP